MKFPAFVLSVVLIVATTTVSPIGASRAKAETFNTLDVLSATVKQFWSCADWSPVGACFWLKCSFFSCTIKVSPKYRNHAPEAVVQTYHAASREPWTETRTINELTFGSNSNIVVSGILRSMGSWLSSLEGGAPAESSRANHRNLTFKNVDVYTHPLVIDLNAIQDYMDPSQWSQSIPDIGNIDISDLGSGYSDIFDTDDFSLSDPPWEAVSEWDILSGISTDDIGSLYGIEQILPDGCDDVNQPSLVPNPNYGDEESVCTGILGYGGSCTNITDEYIPGDVVCRLEWPDDMPTLTDVMNDFEPADLVGSVVGGDVQDYIDVADQLDADEFNELRSEFGEFLDMASFTDWVFCTPKDLLPLQPMYSSHRDLVGWRYNIPEMFYPQSLMPFGGELGTSLNNYGFIYPRHGYSIQHDPIKESALSAFRAAHFVTREGEPHVYQTLATDRKEGYWPPGPLEEDSGKWSMVSPVEESSCHFFPYDSLPSMSYRDEDEAAGWILWREYSCCADLGVFLFDITIL